MLVAALLALSPLESDFLATCLRAFDTPEARPICECAARERRRQKVTDAALRQETAEIRKDPKHIIADRGLRGALQYCTISSLQITE